MSVQYTGTRNSKQIPDATAKDFNTHHLKVPLSTACVTCVSAASFITCRHVAFPSVTQVKVRSINTGDSFLVLASDGVWEFMDNTEASYLHQFPLVANPHHVPGMRRVFVYFKTYFLSPSAKPACDDAAARTSRYPRLSNPEPKSRWAGGGPRMCSRCSSVSLEEECLGNVQQT